MSNGDVPVSRKASGESRKNCGPVKWAGHSKFLHAGYKSERIVRQNNLQLAVFPALWAKAPGGKEAFLMT
jgi:hypothetical protein